MANREFGIGEAGSLPASTPEDEIEAERLQPSPPADTKCSRCGRRANKLSLFWTNTHGGVCEWCYDQIDEDY